VKSGRVSVAIPLYNEEEVMPELLARVTAVLSALPGGPHEVVLVDDGSSDRTLEILAAAAAGDPRLVVVSLSRNFGHQSALSAALDHATGDVLVVMDGDLQDAPEAIPQLLDELDKGFDVVYAKRVARKEGPLLRACYYFFYRAIDALSDVRLPLDAGDFGVLSRRVVDRIRSLPEHHRYLRGLRTWVGFRQTGVPVPRGPRFSGESRYGWRRLFSLAFDGIFSFSMAPLRAAAVLGLFTMLASLAYTLYAVVVKLLHGTTPAGFTALIVVMTLFGGIQLLFLGVIGEYLGRVYEEVKGRPHYVIGQVIRGGKRDGA